MRTKEEIRAEIVVLRQQADEFVYDHDWTEAERLDVERPIDALEWVLGNAGPPSGPREVPG